MLNFQRIAGGKGTPELGLQLRESRKNAAAIRLLAAPLACLIGGVVAFSGVSAQDAPIRTAAALKKLSITELLDMEVMSVSRRPERIGAAASAIQLIRGENIRRSGATSLPEALRLAPNLQVAQVNASQWAVSARGFNNVLANKLLVQIDGRTVYTPLYAGVFWDVQDTLLEDIDRIEVVSGPGGTLWGANAVNGIINITTRNSSDTTGLYLSGGGGNELRSFGEARYGGRVSERTHYRVYAKYYDRDDTELAGDGPAGDAWQFRQGGFRFDFNRTEGSLVTLQGDIYDADPNPDGAGAANVEASGGNLLAHWVQELGPDSNLQVQVYADRTRRDFGSNFGEDLDTYDLDFQHRLPLGANQELIWGAGLRLMDHEVRNIPGFEFLPANITLHLYSGFVQDEATFLDNRLRLTLGTKYEQNDYTGGEWQPSLRLAWSVSEQDTLWTAVSRAVRTPSRIDTDFTLSLAPNFPIIAANPDFESEEVLAVELGWRTQVSEEVSLSISGFYNEYDNLRSVQPGPPPLGLPLTFRNDVEGETYGVELSGIYRPTDNWRLRGGYTFLRKHLVVKEGRVDANNASAESSDPESTAVIQSMLDIRDNLQLDIVARYVDSLPHVTKVPDPHVPSYIGLDARLAWQPGAGIEISIVGTNLLDDSHAEFVPDSPAAREIERGVHGRVTWRF